MSFLTLLIVEFEDAVQLLIVVGIAKTTIGVSIPQHAVVVRRDDEGYADLGIILEEVFILTRHVQLFRLVLT